MAPLTEIPLMIRDIVNDLGLNHRQAARVFGVSYATLHSWLIGSREPSDESLEKVISGLREYGDSAVKLAERVRALHHASRAP